MEVRGIWEISAPSSQFCCRPKTAPKTKVFNFKEKNNQIFNISKWVLFGQYHENIVLPLIFDRSVVLIRGNVECERVGYGD